MLFVGGITLLKNFERLMEAFARVHERQAIPLVVVGFNRWRFENDLAFAKSHRASAHILFPSFVADEAMPQVYRMASCLFFPSIYEGFGIPVPEAFATGCPVVTTNRGCTSEVAGGAAHLVDPFDVEDMAQGLELVLSDQAYCQELIARGRARPPTSASTAAPVNPWIYSSKYFTKLPNRRGPRASLAAPWGISREPLRQCQTYQGTNYMLPPGGVMVDSPDRGRYI
ncbi:MAG: glycosyltransferase [Desulfarculus sp.]|nr:glycosyltransferase [Desulfarculus sp.]